MQFGMKISASIYSSKNQNLKEIIHELDEHGVDYFHVDCNDDMSVFQDIDSIREMSKTPIDLHIISDEPEKYFDAIEKHQVEFVTFQYENLTKVIEFPQLDNTKFGMSITSDTEIDVFDEYVNSCEFILFMATTPGQSGGRFNQNNFRKIRDFRRKFPSTEIRVDGGVNAEVSFILRNMGVASSVVGSYLFNSTVGAALLNLRTRDVESHYLVKDFMRTNEELPILKGDAFSFSSILRSIDAGKLGFTLIQEEGGILKGIISNADVRKGLMAHLEDLNEIKSESLINEHPITINEEMTVEDLLLFVKSSDKTITYLPVVNDQKHLTGAVVFLNLIKGEL